MAEQCFQYKRTGTHVRIRKPPAAIEDKIEICYNFKNG